MNLCGYIVHLYALFIIGEYPFFPDLNPVLPIVDLIRTYASSYACLNLLVNFSFSSSNFLIVYALSARSILKASLSIVRACTFFAIEYPSRENCLSSSFSLATASLFSSNYLSLSFKLSINSKFFLKLAVEIAFAIDFAAFDHLKKA